jgi:hypothetical protein
VYKKESYSINKTLFVLILIPWFIYIIFSKLFTGVYSFKLINDVLIVTLIGIAIFCREFYRVNGKLKINFRFYFVAFILSCLFLAQNTYSNKFLLVLCVLIYMAPLGLFDAKIVSSQRKLNVLKEIVITSNKFFLIMIPFNKPYLSGNEISYIENSIRSGKISGDGIYTKKVHDFFEQKYLFRKCLLTTSCTDALEMCSILLDIKEGDEIIMPAYTFVSTANAFVLRGAKVVFVDSRVDHPGMDETAIEKLITTKTKAIVVVHYAGIACDMDLIMNVEKLYNLYVVEDAAQAIDAYYVNNEGKKIPLGSIGHLAAFSFHETKNIILFT